MRMRKGILIEEEKWRDLKMYCVANKVGIVEKAGDIVSDWIDRVNAENGTGKTLHGDEDNLNPGNTHIQ